MGDTNDDKPLSWTNEDLKAYAKKKYTCPLKDEELISLLKRKEVKEEDFELLPEEKLLDTSESIEEELLRETSRKLIFTEVGKNLLNRYGTDHHKRAKIIAIDQNLHNVFEIEGEYCTKLNIQKLVDCEKLSELHENSYAILQSIRAHFLRCTYWQPKLDSGQYKACKNCTYTLNCGISETYFMVFRNLIDIMEEIENWRGKPQTSPRPPEPFAYQYRILYLSQQPEQMKSSEQPKPQQQIINEEEEILGYMTSEMKRRNPESYSTEPQTPKPQPQIELRDKMMKELKRLKSLMKGEG